MDIFGGGGLFFPDLPNISATSLTPIQRLLKNSCQNISRA